MAMDKDLVRINYNIINKEIWLFLWYTTFKIIFETMTDYMNSKDKFIQIFYSSWSTMLIHL